MFNNLYGKKDIRLKGTWWIRNYGPDGSLKDERTGENVITNNALDFLASFLYSAAVTASTFTMRYAAIGSNDTAEAASDTGLGTELSRTTGTVSYVSDAIYRVTATFAAGSGTGAISEYALFSSSTGGTMFNRDTEAVINKGASDTLVVVTNITIE